MLHCRKNLITNHEITNKVCLSSTIDESTSGSSTIKINSIRCVIRPGDCVIINVDKTWRHLHASTTESPNTQRAGTSNLASSTCFKCCSKSFGLVLNGGTLINSPLGSAFAIISCKTNTRQCTRREFSKIALIIFLSGGFLSL